MQVKLSANYERSKSMDHFNVYYFNHVFLLFYWTLRCKLIINLSLSDFNQICVFFSVYYQFFWFVYFLRSHEHLNVNKILNCFILRRRFLDRTKHNEYINIESIDLPQNN